MTKPPDELSEREVTAYHEAGHTVIAVVLGEEYEYVTINEGPNSLGQVERSKGTDLPDPEQEPTAEHLNKVERRVMFILAGYAAEKMKTRQHGWTGGSNEPQEAEELLRCHIWDDEEFKSRWRSINGRLAEFINTHWKEIEAIAAALLGSLFNVQVGWLAHNSQLLLPPDRTPTFSPPAALASPMG